MRPPRTQPRHPLPRPTGPRPVRRIASTRALCSARALRPSAPRTKWWPRQRTFKELACFTVESSAAFTDEAFNNSICPGAASTRTDEIPSSPETFRVGGSVRRAFFVAPHSGNYSFHLRASGGGEVWMSPDADPRSARRILSSRPEHRDAFPVLPGMSTNKASTLNDEWACSGAAGADDRACFRFFPLYETFEYAEMVCAGHGAVVANPKTQDEVDLLRSISSGGVWIGLSDKGTEGHWYYNDGTYAGAAYDGEAFGDWSYGLWSNNEPNDSGGTENCAEMYSNGYFNDLTCTGNVRRVVCEIRGGGINARETEPMAMEAGDVRYFEAIFYNTFAAKATSLVTLTIDTRSTDADMSDGGSGSDGRGRKFLTSEVLGLSAEYFREIRSDARAVEVSVNGLSSACGVEDTEGSCTFDYSEEHTPTISSVFPAAAPRARSLPSRGPSSRRSRRPIS